MITRSVLRVGILLLGPVEPDRGPELACHGWLLERVPGQGRRGGETGAHGPGGGEGDRGEEIRRTARRGGWRGGGRGSAGAHPPSMAFEAESDPSTGMVPGSCCRGAPSWSTIRRRAIAEADGSSPLASMLASPSPLASESPSKSERLSQSEPTSNQVGWGERGLLGWRFGVAAGTPVPAGQDQAAEAYLVEARRPGWLGRTLYQGGSVHIPYSATVSGCGVVPGRAKVMEGEREEREREREGGGGGIRMRQHTPGRLGAGRPPSQFSWATAAF